MKDEWGPWISHDGSPCPVVGQYVRLRFKDLMGMKPSAGDLGAASRIKMISDYEAEGIASCGGSWTWEPLHFPIIRYRVRRPRGMIILDEALNISEEDFFWAVY